MFLSRIRNVHSVQRQYNEGSIQTPNEGFYLHYLQVFSYAFDPDQLPPVSAYLKHPSFSYRQSALIKKPKIDVEQLGISEPSLPRVSPDPSRRQGEKTEEISTAHRTAAAPDTGRESRSAASATWREADNTGRVAASLSSGEGSSPRLTCSSVSGSTSPRGRETIEQGCAVRGTMTGIRTRPQTVLQQTLVHDQQRYGESGHPSALHATSPNFHTPHTSPSSVTPSSDLSRTASADRRRDRQDNRSLRDPASQSNGNAERHLHLYLGAQTDIDPGERGESPRACPMARGTRERSFPSASEPGNACEHARDAAAYSPRFLGQAASRDELYRNPYSGHASFAISVPPGAEPSSYERASPGAQAVERCQTPREVWQPPGRAVVREVTHECRYGREVLHPPSRGRERYSGDNYDAPRRDGQGSLHRQGGAVWGELPAGVPRVKEEFRGHHQQSYNRT